MNIFRFVPLAASLVALTMTTNAHAVEPAPAFNYSIEQFQIDKNISGSWNTIFIDTFSSATNAAAPGLTAPNFTAAGGGGAASYGVFGSFATNSLDGSGPLQLDNTGTALSSDPLGNPVYTQQARLLTSTDNTNSSGLKINSSFMVTGIFDLTTPVAGTAYGIRLSDQTSTIGNDRVSLVVRNSASGINIDFTKLDFLVPSIVTVDSTAASFTSPFIALRLSHDDPTNQLVTASFAYLSSVGDLAAATWTTFGNTATIFNGENFTRAEFRAIAAVPEADTWAMMAVGVGLIGLQLRRRNGKGSQLTIG